MVQCHIEPEFNESPWKMPLCMRMGFEVLISSDERTDQVVCHSPITVAKTLLVYDQCGTDEGHKLVRCVGGYQKLCSAESRQTP